ncbi:MAG: DUF4142 domain-containing protein [Chthoniobacteraceae bacterium]
MRTLIFSIALSAAAIATAVPRKKPQAVPAKAAVPAQPAVASDSAKPPSQLISSDLGGRDMVFVAQAVDLGKALRYLATQTPRTSNPALRGFGDDIVKTLAAQTAVLNTVAEMRQLKIPDTESATEKRIAEKVAPLEGIKLEKALLDAFIDVDRQLISAYELGAKSDDVTIRKFVDQTLPHAREHLVLVEAMAGMSSNRPAPVSAGSASASDAAPKRPVFRTGVPLQAQPAPDGGR